MSKSTSTFRVRYSECDPMSVAHHAAYPIWFEIGRTEMLREQGGFYGDIEKNGLFFVVAELVVKYKSSAKYDDVLTLVTNIDSCSPACLCHSYKLMRDDILIATATTTLACVNSEGAVQRFPNSVLQN